MADGMGVDDGGVPWAPPGRRATRGPADLPRFAAPAAGPGGVGHRITVEHGARQPAGVSALIRQLLDADRTGVVVIRSDGTIETVNEAMLALLSARSIDELRGATPAHRELRAFLDHLPQQLLDERGGSWSGDVDHRTADGEVRVLRATAHVSDDEHGRPGSIALLLHDVSDARRRLGALERRVTHDPLTDLANREQIIGDLARAVGEQRQLPGHVAAISVDLDHLKHVNDALGQQAGDQLIVSTATRLTQAVRPSDRVARVGGDEFLVVSPGISDGVMALEVAERVERALRGNLRLGDVAIDVSASVGIALTSPDMLAASDDHASAALLVGSAETAMRDAKARGGGRAILCGDEMQAAVRQRSELTASLARSVNQRSLTVDYQPVFSTISKTAVGAEALARWNHPTLGPIDAATFISVAEESGLIGRLGEEILDRAMSDHHRWVAAGTVSAGFSVHVNVSSVQLASASFVNMVLAKLRDHRFDPARLVLEARETALSGRRSDVDRSIRALRRHGVHVAVDNFGTGPKALEVMTDMGADVVKLNGPLALPAGSSDADTRLVRAIVLFAHALGMGVVAERVTGVEQLHRLQAAGCDMVQGYLLGEPRNADEFTGVSAIDW